MKGLCIQKGSCGKSQREKLPLGVALVDQMTAALPVFCRKKQGPWSSPLPFLALPFPDERLGLQSKEVYSDFPTRGVDSSTSSSFRNNGKSLSHVNSCLQPASFFHVYYGVLIILCPLSHPYQDAGVCVMILCCTIGEATAQKGPGACRQPRGWSRESDSRLLPVAPPLGSLFCCIYTVVGKVLHILDEPP